MFMELIYSTRVIIIIIDALKFDVCKYVAGANL